MEIPHESYLMDTVYKTTPELASHSSLPPIAPALAMQHGGRSAMVAKYQYSTTTSDIGHRNTSMHNTSPIYGGSSGKSASNITTTPITAPATTTDGVGRGYPPHVASSSPLHSLSRAFNTLTTTGGISTNTNTNANIADVTQHNCLVSDKDTSGEASKSRELENGINTGGVATTESINSCSSTTSATSNPTSALEININYDSDDESSEYYLSCPKPNGNPTLYHNHDHDLTEHSSHYQHFNAGQQVVDDTGGGSSADDMVIFKKPKLNQNSRDYQHAQYKYYDRPYTYHSGSNHTSGSKGSSHTHAKRRKSSLNAQTKFPTGGGAGTGSLSNRSAFSYTHSNQQPCHHSYAQRLMTGTGGSMNHNGLPVDTYPPQHPHYLDQNRFSPVDFSSYPDTDTHFHATDMGGMDNNHRGDGGGHYGSLDMANMTDMTDMTPSAMFDLISPTTITEVDDSRTRTSVGNSYNNSGHNSSSSTSSGSHRHDFDQYDPSYVYEPSYMNDASSSSSAGVMTAGTNSSITSKSHVDDETNYVGYDVDSDHTANPNPHTNTTAHMEPNTTSTTSDTQFVDCSPPPPPTTGNEYTNSDVLVYDGISSSGDIASSCSMIEHSAHTNTCNGYTSAFDYPIDGYTYTDTDDHSTLPMRHTATDAEQWLSYLDVTETSDM